MKLEPQNRKNDSKMKLEPQNRKNDPMCRKLILGWEITESSPLTQIWDDKKGGKATLRNFWKYQNDMIFQNVLNYRYSVANSSKILLLG